VVIIDVVDGGVVEVLEEVAVVEVVVDDEILGSEEVVLIVVDVRKFKDVDASVIIDVVDGGVVEVIEEVAVVDCDEVMKRRSSMATASTASVPQ
jgi:hypothetical protein